MLFLSQSEKEKSQKTHDIYMICKKQIQFIFYTLCKYHGFFPFLTVIKTTLYIIEFTITLYEKLGQPGMIQNING